MLVGRTPIIGAAAIWLSACSPIDRGSASRFTATGELIALSGGDAGAANACFTCHGLDGSGNGAGAPRLAELDRGYMAAQLQAYASGRRQHPEMAHIASKLTLAQQDAVSEYYSAMPFATPRARGADRPASAAYTLYHRGDTARRLASCASCHGAGGEGIGPANPPLAGQPAPYLAEQFDQWRASRRRNDPQNVMLHISRALSHQEAEALAVYASGLPGDPPRRESRAASLAAHRGDPRNDASAPPPRGVE